MTSFAAWLHHTAAGGVKGDTNFEKGLDVKWLQSALELDNTNGKTWYLLGRCQAALNRVQEAFAAYRSSIDKTEASADTWSVGVFRLTVLAQHSSLISLLLAFCFARLSIVTYIFSQSVKPLTLQQRALVFVAISEHHLLKQKKNKK